MSIFKKIASWFTAGTEYRGNLLELVEYLPVGDLDALLFWGKKFIPYKSDVDAQGDYDPLQNYNGADLTIKARGGDCESIAAVFKEVISSPEWTAAGFAADHVCMVYADDTAHDVCFFQGAEGGTGWIDGKIYYGNYAGMREHYDGIGWHIVAWWIANDIGQEVKEL